MKSRFGMKKIKSKTNSMANKRTRPKSVKSVNRLEAESKPELVVKDSSANKDSSAKDTYFLKHWNILKNSFVIDGTILKLICIDLGFIFTILLSYMLLYALWLRNTSAVSNLLNMIYSGQLTDVAGYNLPKIWHQFLINTILLFVLIILIYILLLSVYGALSHTIITKNRFNWRLILNFICVYSGLTGIYLFFLIAMFFLSKNIMLLTWGLIIFTFLYLYLLLIFYLVTKEGKFGQILVHGFKSALKLHNTLPPMILALLILSILTVLIQVLFGGLSILITLLVLVSLLYISAWIKRYMHKIIHS
jgi:hypothetical protein